MLTVEEALEAILSRVPVLGTERVDLLGELEPQEIAAARPGHPRAGREVPRRRGEHRRLLGFQGVAQPAQVAVEAAVLHNFFWHQRFTWADRASLGLRDTLGRLLRFNLTNGGLSIRGNLILMRLLVGRLHLNYVVANLLTIAACSLVNFLVSHRFVFVP